MRSADQSARGPRITRVPLRSGLVALLALTALAGCSDPSTSSSSADVVTTGPEPGAEIATTPTTPGATTPAGATTPSTTPDDEGKKKRHKRDREDKAKPTPTPAAQRASTGSDPEPTIMPATTLKPKEPTDAVDLAFARELLIHHSAVNIAAQEVEKRATHPEFRALATTIVDRAGDTFGTMQNWGDVLGPVLSQAGDTKYLAEDLRRLGVAPDTMKQARALILRNDYPFSDVSDEKFDETALKAMIELHGTSIDLAAGTIQEGGSPRFRKFAAKFERQRREELKQMLEFKRDW